MRDTARDPAALELELLRVQRSRLADRMRPPWWYLPGATIAVAVQVAAQQAAVRAIRRDLRGGGGAA